MAGGGLAGLSLAYRLRKDPFFDDQSILILDSSTKTENDRTWCFWSREKDLFDPIIHHSWKKLSYLSTGIDKQSLIEPYSYKMIRGLDFYEHCRAFLKNKTNTYFQQAQIKELTETSEGAIATTDGGNFFGKRIYKSYPDKLEFKEDHFVWQHFKGWIIESAEPSIDPAQATLMDFRIEQGNEVRFFYVLPLTETRAMVEFTIFSKEIFASSDYDPELQKYLKEFLDIKNYKVLEEEIGAIPMTTHDFQKGKDSQHIIPIGTNGGSVKASSGYAFTRVQRDMKRLVEQLKKGQEIQRPKSRYDFYDRIMMNAILTDKCTGKAVFDGLFRKLSFQSVFKFLDEEGGLLNDLKVFTGPPTWPFLKAFFEEL